MKAFVVDRYGKKAALRAADMPMPELREDEVLVQIHAAGVNLLDSKIRSGEFQTHPAVQLPLILGHDVAGVLFAPALEGGNSSPATKCIPDPTIFASVLSPNS